MAKTVFIFGAGASAHLGVPLMNSFIDRADELRQEQSVSRPDFDLVFSLIQARLPRLHAKSVVDLTNIESVFSLIEMGRLIGRLPDTSPEEVDTASLAMRRVLAETVQETCLFTMEQGQWKPSSPYLSVVGHIEREAKAGQSVSLITFNYDVGLDFALHWSDTAIDYGLTKALAPRSVPLLKLHGSLNWTACTECKQVHPIALKQVFALQANRSLRDRSVRRLPLPVTQAFGSIGHHCPGSTRPLDPAIVPPSWNKTQYHDQFSQVWRHAARELSEAQDIRVFGYSLPQADAFFRDLLALGLAGSARLKSFVVVDPSGATAGRFQQLLGPDAKGRFRHEERPFEDYAKFVLKPHPRD